MTGDIVKKDEMVYGHLSDLEMAVKVRMLFRDTLEHESVCCGARDRIMYLSQQVARLKNAMSWVVDNFPAIREADDCTFDGETFEQIAKSV